MNESPRPPCAAHQLLLCVLLWCVYGISAWNVLMECRLVDPGNLLAEYRFGGTPALFSGLCAGLILLFAVSRILRISPVLCGRAMLPAVLLIPCLCSAGSLWNIIAFVAVTALVAARLSVSGSCAVLTRWRRKLLRLPLYVWPLALGGVIVLLSVLALLMFFRSVDQANVMFQDWGIFHEVALNTVHGEFLKSYWHNGINFFSDHFMPGFFLWYIPLTALCPSPSLLPFLSVLFLYGSGFPVYAFARSRGLNGMRSFLLAMVYLLIPGITNMNLCLYYGFHVIYFFIPVFLLFYLAYESGRGKTALALFLFSLTIKETTAAFWIGWAACVFCSGKRKTGLLYGLIAAAYLVACQKWIIPAFLSPEQAGGAYKYNTYFSGLGNGMAEIAMSPLTKPRLFWGLIFSERTLMYPLLLALPVFCAALFRPVMLFPGTLQILFVLLLSSQHNANLSQQYQTETVAMMAVSAVLGLIALQNSPGVRFFRWGRILFSGLPRVRKVKAEQGVLLAVVLSALLCHWFFTATFYGKSGLWKRYTDSRQLITGVEEEVRALIPAGDTVGVDEISGRLLMGYARVTECHAGFGQWNYALLDAGTGIFAGNDVYQELLRSPEYGLIWKKSLHNRRFYFLFQKGVPDRFAAPLIRIPDAEWRKLPPLTLEAPQSPEAVSWFDAALIRTGGQSFGIAIRLKVPLKHLFFVRFSSGGELLHKSIFAEGVSAPERIAPGSVYIVPMSPAEIARLDRLELEPLNVLLSR